MGIENLVEIVDNIVKYKINYKSNHNSFAELLFEVLSEDVTKITLVDNDIGRKWTAGELNGAIVTLGVKLSEFGVSKGDTVVFFCPNCDLHVITKLSVWAIGAIYTGLIHKSPLRELINVITKTNATFLIGCKDTLKVCNEFMSSNKAVKKFFVIEETSDASLPSIDSLIKCAIASKQKETFFELMSNVKPSDLCKIGFSSGTTGEPKPVKETHSRYISYIYSSFTGPEINMITKMDTCAILQPLVHIGGSIMLCLFLVNRAGIVVFSHFDCDRFVRDVQKHRITFACIVPSHLNLLNRTISEPLKSFCLKKVLTGGEFPQEFICREFIAKFKPEYFGQGLASTETGRISIVSVSEGITNLKSVGLPNPGIVIKIVHPETGEILGANKVGEICVKGPETTEGYLNNEKANQESFDEQSFFKCGDLGYFDERGYIYIVDRLVHRIKEVIKYNTQQVSPIELQGILLQHESVKETAVVGIPDEVYGQLPKAFVVLKDEFKDNVTEDELLHFVNTQVSDFKQLRGGLTFLSEIPKSTVGKIDRRALKSL